MDKRKINLNLLDTDSATEAIDKVAEIADRNKIDWALCGGIAMSIYGSPRLTKDIDVIASQRLPLPPSEIIAYLKQGDEHFKIKTKRQEVLVDWILRNDEAKRFYQQALHDSVMIDGVPILTPEWLVILKYIAGLFKDQEDAIYLLGAPNLVSRQKLKSLVLSVGGDETWAVFKGGLKRWYDLADGKTDEIEDGYIDS